MQGFLTGSHAYGIPGINSDIDLCVLVHPWELGELKSQADNQDELQEYANCFVLPLRFANLNLLAFTSEAAMCAWKLATEELKKRSPKPSRQAAIDLIQSHLKRLNLEYGDDAEVSRHD